MTEKTEHTVYMVERFLPTRCPKPGCFNEFKEIGRNGYFIATYWLHESREATEQIRASSTFPGLSTDLIICATCRNVTLRVKIEDQMFATRVEAEAALTNGFVNLQEMISYGTPPLGRFVYRNAPSVENDKHYCIITKGGAP